MAIEVLILAQDLPGWRRKGYVVYEKDAPAVWGSREGLPNFIRVTVTGAVTIEQARAYRNVWRCKYDWTVDQHTPATDTYRVTIFGDKVNVSGIGAITRAKLDDHLPNMGFVFFAEAANAITYDFSIYDVTISNWFWRREVSSVSFQENDYNESTGIHTIEADYSAAGWPANKVEKVVELRGGIIASHNANVITFTLNRSDVNAALKKYFRERVDSQIEERQFYVSTSYVDSVVSGGGLDTKTKSEFLALINDRLDE